VPRLLGYRPRRSIVFVNIHDEAGVSTLRVDLPDEAPHKIEKKFITALLGTLCKVPGVRKTLIVVYADGPFDAGGDVPRASFVRPLIRRVLDSGFIVHDALCVADDAWGAYDGDDAGVPHALDELEEPAPGDDGSEPVAADVDEIGALPVCGHLARRAFDAAFDRAWGRGRFRPVAEAEAALALDPVTADSDELATVLAVLLDPELRDAVLFTWAWGEERGYELLELSERIAAGEIDEGDDTLALDLMGLGHAEQPDRERIGRGIRLMSRIAALAPDDVAHIAFTVLAWLHWSQGRGSVAGRFVDRARELDPRYGLAELLASVLQHGMLPEWAFRRPGISG
jgi:hypothetical protein